MRCRRYNIGRYIEQDRIRVGACEQMQTRMPPSVRLVLDWLGFLLFAYPQHLLLYDIGIAFVYAWEIVKAADNEKHLSGSLHGMGDSGIVCRTQPLCRGLSQSCDNIQSSGPFNGSLDTHPTKGLCYAMRLDVSWPCVDATVREESTYLTAMITRWQTKIRKSMLSLRSRAAVSWPSGT
jgi:hypothetical protein